MGRLTSVNWRVPRILVAALFAWTLSSCVSAPTPDLARLYSSRGGDIEQPPIVLIHGALGSQLSDTASGKEVWPGSMLKIVFSKYEVLKYDIDPENLTPAASRIQSSGIATSAWGVDYYGRILKILENAGGSNTLCGYGR